MKIPSGVPPPGILGANEAGDREMPSEVWIALADFYEVTVDYLMGRTE